MPAKPSRNKILTKCNFLGTLLLQLSGDPKEVSGSSVNLSVNVLGQRSSCQAKEIKFMLQLVAETVRGILINGACSKLEMLAYVSSFELALLAKSKIFEQNTTRFTIAPFKGQMKSIVSITSASEFRGNTSTFWSDKASLYIMLGLTSLDPRHFLN